MKKLVVTGLTLVLLVGLMGVAGARDDYPVKKIPLGAFLSSAKIDIISGDLERYEEAIEYLNAVSHYYGPHAEALHLMSQIYIDFFEREPSLQGKMDYVEKMVIYMDSLKVCCENEEIDKDHRKDCDEYTSESDSIKVKYWREFYNAGLSQLNEMQRIKEESAGAADSAEEAFYQEALQANFDSSLANMKMAIMLDETDYRTYVGIGTAYEHMADYPSAIEWKKKGLAASPDSAQLLFSIAYNYVTMDDYCGAIPWLKGYLEYAPEDVDNYYNLAVCYNNCKMYDSAAAVYRYMLSIDSTNADALSGMGRYYNELGRTATDSTTYYQSAGNNEKVVEWQARKNEAFDSSRTYFGRAFRQSPDDKFVAEMYAVVHAITGKFQEAAMGFARLTELEPDNAEHWTSLGDCYLNLKEWEQAVGAYEKVVELEPGNAEIWEQLKDIYHELGNTAKETEAANKLDSLQQG